MSKAYFRAAAALLAVLCLVSCHRRPLFDPSELIRISVEVDVDNISNVTCDIYNPDPALGTKNVSTDMMRVMVYDPDNDKLLTQSFISEKSTNEKGHEVISGTLEIGSGNFDILAYNFDTPDTYVRDENDQNTITAYTNEIPASLKANYTKATDFAALKAFYEPDHFFVAQEKDYHIGLRDTLVVIKTAARTIVDTYYIQIPVVGLPAGTRASGVISGLSPANAFGTKTRSSDASGVYFEMITSTDEHLTTESKDVLCGIFNTFGKLDASSSDVRFTVGLTDAEGNVYQKDFNLDLIFKSADAIEHHWLLIDEVWEFDRPDPTPGTSGGGFQPQVDEWEQEEGGIAL